MNYIEQINNFWIAQESHQFNTNEIALYFYLLGISNRLNWTDNFKRNNAKIIADLGISFKALQAARNRLQQAEIIDFKTKNGVPNVTYSMIDLCLYGKGNGRGSGGGNGRGSGGGNGRGSGGDNINQTKTETKLNNSKSHCGEKSPPTKKIRKEEKNLFWADFVSVFEKFYIEKTGEKYQYLEKDWGCLDKIYQFLKKRADLKKYEWTEEQMKNGFLYFLNLAYNKDNWLQQNFTIPNILSQFNQIANGQQSTANSSAKPATGANVDMRSAFEKLNQMS